MHTQTNIHSESAKNQLNVTTWPHNHLDIVTQGSVTMSAQSLAQTENILKV